MAIRRPRSRVAAETEREAPQPTKSRLAAKEAPQRRVMRRARAAVDAAEAPLIVSAPNTDAVLGEVIDRGSVQIQTQRPGNYLHVSDLLSKCIRKRALEQQYELGTATRRLTMSDMLTFAQGDAIHDTLKDRARVGAPQMVWGIWSCKCGSLKHEEPCTFSEIDQEEECEHCGSKVDHYNEVSMVDEEYGVVGNPDLILYLPRKAAFHVTELKSIAHDQWVELARPKPDHVLQTVWYWLLMSRKGYRLTDRVSIFYVTKGWQFGNKKTYKEFLIDPQAELHRLESMIEDALAYKAFLAGGPPPVRTFCSHPDSKDAKGCAASTFCFEV